MDREALFARITLTNKLALVETAAKLDRSQNEVVDEIFNAWRLGRPFALTKKESSKTSVEINRKKAKELRDKRKARRGKK